MDRCNKKRTSETKTQKEQVGGSSDNSLRKNAIVSLDHCDETDKIVDDNTCTEDEEEEKNEKLLKLRGLNMSYKNKIQKLKTVDQINPNNRIIKLITDDVHVNPKILMEHLMKLLKTSNSLNTKIKIDDITYKVKYKEVVPEDHILFTKDVKHITNCKYMYIGILEVSKYVKKEKFKGTKAQSWHMCQDF